MNFKDQVHRLKADGFSCEEVEKLMFQAYNTGSRSQNGNIREIYFSTHSAYEKPENEYLKTDLMRKPPEVVERQLWAANGFVPQQAADQTPESFVHQIFIDLFPHLNGNHV